ncbi:hypothetical protein H6G33_11565 [Calothrix sp. FACHB-1219]|uniref:hypothetical protein n=1 Tax=unclassified Calothrix TaxID=2619626 RepID=UPI001683B974|nr:MULTISPECIES: hypothetical protein [unclassified Calothrix]MBD2202262.1 hypothetical protein [Calothrix sp. FACHB-168]MBD2217668.1 hypothetical protein [Calothrix sp. FACHB-1219]
MHNSKNWQKTWLGAGATLALLGAAIAPASAQSVIIIYGDTQPGVSSYDYGNSIVTPIPINRVYKHPGNRGNYYRRRGDDNYRRTTIYSYPPYPQTIINPSVTYPNMVHPMFRNQPLRNPVFDQRPDYQPNYRQFRGRSRSILLYPR